MRDAEGQKYAEMVHAHQTLKNRHGGIPEKKSHESLDHSTVLNRRDRRQPGYGLQPALIQRPSPKAKKWDTIGYENSPLMQSEYTGNS